MMFSTLGLFLGLVLMVVGRIITTLAVKSLPTEKKAALVDKMAHQNSYGFIPVILVIAAYYLALNYSNIDSHVLLVAYFVILTAFVVIFEILYAKKIRALELGTAYIRRYSAGRILSFIGIALILVGIIPGRA